MQWEHRYYKVRNPIHNCSIMHLLPFELLPPRSSAIVVKILGPAISTNRSLFTNGEYSWIVRWQCYLLPAPSWGAGHKSTLYCYCSLRSRVGILMHLIPWHFHTGSGSRWIWIVTVNGSIFEQSSVAKCKHIFRGWILENGLTELAVGLTSLSQWVGWRFDQLRAFNFSHRGCQVVKAR